MSLQMNMYIYVRESKCNRVTMRAHTHGHTHRKITLAKNDDLCVCEEEAVYVCKLQFPGLLLLLLLLATILYY